MSDQDPSVSPAHGWALLRIGELETTALEIPTLPTNAKTAAGEVRLAVTEKSESRVLIPIHPSESIRGIVDAPSLKISIVRLRSSGQMEPFLDLICVSKSLESVFSEVVGEILSRISDGVSGTLAVETTIRDFRDLLDDRDEDIDDGKIVGLVAELLILDRLLEQSADAWKCWRGPHGDRHDFRNGGLSLEVKASMSKAQTRIFIHGLDQLEAPEDGQLYIHHMVLEPVGRGLVDIAVLWSSIESKSSEIRPIEDAFAVLGLTRENIDRWSRLSFRLEDEKLYRVDNDFPRLVPSNLRIERNGISDVSYAVDLAYANDSILPESYWQTVALELTSID